MKKGIHRWMGRLLALITTIVLIAGCTKEFEADLPDNNQGTTSNTKKQRKMS